MSAKIGDMSEILAGDTTTTDDATIASTFTNGNKSKSNRNTTVFGPDALASSFTQPVHVAEYLYRRLYEIGIRSVHGVTGEHNLATLDFLEICGLNWVGNCNALNAGYAADGYARIKGTAALFTTFGAGELSALNAIAGAYAEYVPIIHIVGTPPIPSQQNDLLVHHMLGNGNQNTFSDMARSISCGVFHLKDPAIIPEQIDAAIRDCRVHSRPVYIYLPSDVTQYMVEGQLLQTRVDVSLPQNDVDKEDYVADVILRYLHAAQNPVILVDACAIRFRARMEVHELAEKSGIPTFVTPMAKGAVSESLPNYCGVYAGDGSEEDVQERVEAADLVLNIGTMKANFSTPGFNYRVSELSTIDINNDHVRVKYSEYSDLRMAGLLRTLNSRMSTVNIVPGPNPQNLVPFYARRDNESITHAWFWKSMARWLQPNDIIIAGTGTSSYGLWEIRFPPNVTSINQTLWSSPGYATPACLGAALAAAEIARKTNRKHRVILFTGDSSFQSTMQEVSTMMRHNLQPIIFLLNNEGHSTDRLLHKQNATYNDIHPWKYKDLLSAFNGRGDTFQACAVSSRKQVQSLFQDEEFNSAACLQLVELLMDRNDGPIAVLKNTPGPDLRTLSIPPPPHSPAMSISPQSPALPPMPTSPLPPLPVTPQSPAFPAGKAPSRKSSWFNLRPSSSGALRPGSSGSALRPGSSSTVQTSMTVGTMHTARERV